MSFSATLLHTSWVCHLCITTALPEQPSRSLHRAGRHRSAQPGRRGAQQWLRPAWTSSRAARGPTTSRPQPYQSSWTLDAWGSKAAPLSYATCQPTCGKPSRAAPRRMAPLLRSLKGRCWGCHAKAAAPPSQTSTWARCVTCHVLLWQRQLRAFMHSLPPDSVTEAAEAPALLSKLRECRASGRFRSMSAMVDCVLIWLMGCSCCVRASWPQHAISCGG